MEFDIRQGTPEGGERVRQDARIGRRRDVADGDPARLAAAEALELGKRFIGLRHDLHRVLEQCIPGGGQFDSALGAIEQRQAYDCLQSDDLLAESGLCNAEPCCRALEISLLNQSDEVSQMPQFEIGGTLSACGRHRHWVAHCCQVSFQTLNF
ncbi:hypothetical protein D3C72_1717630 [compost metagenome]